MPLHAQADAKLVAMVPEVGGGLPMPILLAGAGGAGVGLLLMLVGVLMTGRKADSATTQPLELRNATTQVSGVQPIPTANTPVDFPSGPTSVGPGNFGTGQALGR